MERMKLKLFRIERKLTQAQMASKIGYNRCHYALIENGSREYSLRFLNAFAEAFALPVPEAIEILKQETE